MRRPLAVLAAALVLAGAAACGSTGPRVSAQPFVLPDLAVGFGGLAVTADGTVVVVGQKGITTVDPTTLAITGTTGGSGFEKVTTGSDAGHVFLLDSSAGLEQLDLRTHLVTVRLPARSTIELPTELLCVCAGGTLLFGANATHSNLTVIDLPAARIATTITMPPALRSAAVVVADGSRIYQLPPQTVGGPFDVPVSAVDVATGKSTPVPGTEGAQSLALSADGPRIWVIGVNGLAVIDGAGNSARRVTRSSPGGGEFVGSPDGRVLAGTDLPDHVTLIDTADGSEIASVPVGGFPRALAFAPDSSRLWVGTDKGLVGVPLGP